MTDFEKTYQNYNPRQAALDEARALLTEAAKPEGQKLEEAWNRLKRDIASSAQTIHNIDTGKARGYSRALFVSSILNKVSTYAGKGEVEIVKYMEVRSEFDK